MKRVLKEFVTIIFAAALGFAPAALIGYAWETTPVIYVSHSTGECVSWQDANGFHACTSAPNRAERVWVR